MGCFQCEFLKLLKENILLKLDFVIWSDFLPYDDAVNVVCEWSFL